MRLAALLLITAAALSPAFAAAPVAIEAPAKADAQFAKLAERFIENIAQFNPVSGTQLGDHRFDDKLPDISAAGRARQKAFAQQLLAELNAIDRKTLSRDAQVDALLLKNALEYELWDHEELKSWSWNAQTYNNIAGQSLYGLAARDFAPWPQRLKAATARMEALPAFLLESREQLDLAKVPQIYATTIAKQNSGIIDIVQSMLVPHIGELPPTERARFEKAFAGLKIAVADQQKWLDNVLVPNAKGDFRLGAERYDRKMKFELLSDMTRPELKAKALAAHAQTRAEMYDLARQVLAGKPGAPELPEKPTPAQQQKAIEAALELSYARRPDRHGLIEQAKSMLDQAKDFAREKDLISMPSAAVKIIEMPKFQQGYSVAYADSPGPLDKAQETFYAIAPIPDDWSDEQAISFLREYNYYMIHDLNIHEAIPGHWLQIDHSNQNKSVLRSVLSSGPFVEGWAVYAEQLMADAGYLNNDPLFKLTVLKMRLRSITNTLLDIGIQTEGMTREQAMDLMMNGAFQQEREAAGKWVRAQLNSVQLLSYYSGYEAHRAMRAEAEQRDGAGFNLKHYNDSVLAHGSPPARFVRQLVFGLPVE